MQIAVSQVEYHREEFLKILDRKLLACVRGASNSLVLDYRSELQREIAPPHSKIGEIPHAYLGWKPGGYGPTNETLINNPGQTEFLSNFIDYEAGDFFFVSATIGFKPNHTLPGDNYLIMHDREGRPWIRPILDKALPAARIIAKESFDGG